MAERIDWPAALAGWVGRLVDLRIVDRAGIDPVAPPKLVTLHRLGTRSADGSGGKELLFYLNEQQFLSVPVFAHPLTRLEDGAFVSEDAERQLVYQVILAGG